MNTPGRNEPCYCGSGKKYKQCHMRADQAAEREQRTRAEAARFLRLDLPRYARDEQFSTEFDAAMPGYWNELYTPENAHEMSEFEALRYLDWLAYDHKLEDGSRIVEQYHSEIRPELSQAQQDMLDLWLNAAPFWAYELTGYDGKLLHLRDFMSDETFEVIEASGRGNVEVGEVLLIRLVPVDNHLEFSTLAAYLPAAEIAGLKEKLEAARAEQPDLSEEEFRRQNNVILIHHALEQAQLVGRPPVARLDPNRTDPPIERRIGHEKEQVHRQRNYGSTQSHTAQIRRKVI